jgi:hypothetical protein
MFSNKRPVGLEKATGTSDDIQESAHAEVGVQAEIGRLERIDHPQRPAGRLEGLVPLSCEPERAADTLDEAAAVSAHPDSPAIVNRHARQDETSIGEHVVPPPRQAEGVLPLTQDECTMSNSEGVTQLTEMRKEHIRGGFKVLGHGVNRRSPTGDLEPHLRIAAVLQKDEDRRYQALVLLDTGAEVSLIRKGLLPANLFCDAASPFRLIAANNQIVEGGNLEVELAIHFCGVGKGTRTKHVVEMPITLVEAEIDQDLILSYRWMGERGILIDPRKHGFWVQGGGQDLWVEGLRRDPTQRANARLRKSLCSSKASRWMPVYRPSQGLWTCFAAGRVPHECSKRRGTMWSLWIMIQRDNRIFAWMCLSGITRAHTLQGISSSSWHVHLAPNIVRQ